MHVGGCRTKIRDIMQALTSSVCKNRPILDDLNVSHDHFLELFLERKFKVGILHLKKHAGDSLFPVIFHYSKVNNNEFSIIAVVA